MTKITVTPEQVRAARLEVDALRSAGLVADPMVVRLARASSEGAYTAPQARRMKRPLAFTTGKAAGVKSRSTFKTGGRRSKVVTRSAERRKAG